MKKKKCIVKKEIQEEKTKKKIGELQGTNREEKRRGESIDEGK